MNKRTLVVISLALATTCGLAQDANPVAPATLNPKPVPKTTIAQPMSPRPNPQGDKPINPDEPNLAIKAIVLVKSLDEIQQAGLPATNGVIIRDIPFLDRPDFRQLVDPFIGKLLTENRIRDLQDTIILYSRRHNRLLVDVVLPEQNIENGVLQLWYLKGKVGKVTVNNPGRKWFSDKLIQENIHLRAGEPVDTHQLNRDLAWLNNNPFRQVNAAFKPGDKLGLTDVQLDVNDRIPVRPYVGYENSGTRYTGPDRLLAGFNWGDAFHLDQQLNYQFTADVNFDLVKAHSASYIIPLPWRHTITIFGSYVDAKANFGASGGGLSAKGTSWQTSMRYSIPLPDIAKYRQQVSAGFDFKSSDNNLLFGGTNAPSSATKTEAAQFELGYSGILPDRFGRTSFGLEVYYSPGGLTGKNNDASFNSLRTGAKAKYFYGRLNALRVTGLPHNFSWIIRGWGQLANERLLPSEQLALGGYNTVRGYEEVAVLGDDGWILSTELRTPPLFLGNLLGVPNGRDELQLLAFCDSGGAYALHPTAGEANKRILCAVGAGVRWTVSRNFAFRFDYGVPLTEKGLNGPGGARQRPRGHVGALLSF